MKKIYGLIIASALVIGVGSALAYKELSPTPSHSQALSKTFKNTEEIVKDSKVIVNGSVPQKYKQEKVGNLIFYVYEVEVNKVYNNLTSQKIDEGNTIELYRLIGFDAGSSVVNIVDEKNQEIEQGNYLLFLNGEYDEELKKNVLIPNTPNQLFKLNEANSLNAQENNEYTNVFETETLPSISEKELITTIDHLK
ncbi:MULTISPECIES: hypothetical protein [Brevibacillus]|uniref:hypothetical protein n=1 Tax=Brevibacillus TaxID=55080 RepID=UPI000E2FD320|nr:MULTISPECIES: hypothetical protein [Brevibacillus]MCG7317633.1 hypothetical protein [Brevibacillus laterosporus]MED1789074.1 hypothetical protein [Brevibacillus laterosporus]RFB34964.1 hypothetical protein DZB91_10570 [Brevibacillus sp. VP]